VEPLAEALAQELPPPFCQSKTYPIRTGVSSEHGVSDWRFALDYATARGNRRVADLLNRGTQPYLLWQGCELSSRVGTWRGKTSFSPALIEADLMRRGAQSGRVTPSGFIISFPILSKAGPQAILHPATVSDRSDPKLVHLDGLNLTRGAWCMRSIATRFAEE